MSDAGHNSNELTDEQLRALHLNQHVPKYEEALAAKKRADAAFKNVCKAIKAEGGSLDTVKMTLALRTDAGVAALKANVEETLRAMRWNGLPEGTQTDLFEDAARTPLEERAFEAGKVAGLAGESGVPPHDASTAAGQKWIAGWHEGQAALARSMPAIGKRQEAELIKNQPPRPKDDFDDLEDAEAAGSA